MAKLRSSGSGRTQVDPSRGPDRVVVLRGCRRTSAVHMRACARAGPAGPRRGDGRMSAWAALELVFALHLAWGPRSRSSLAQSPAPSVDGRAHLGDGRAGPGHTCRRPTGDGPQLRSFLRLPFARPRRASLGAGGDALASPAPSRLPDRQVGPTSLSGPTVIRLDCESGGAYSRCRLGGPDDPTPRRRPASTTTTRSAPPFVGRWEPRALWPRVRPWQSVRPVAAARWRRRPLGVWCACGAAACWRERPRTGPPAARADAAHNHSDSPTGDRPAGGCGRAAKLPKTVEPRS